MRSECHIKQISYLPVFRVHIKCVRWTSGFHLYLNRCTIFEIGGINIKPSDCSFTSQFDNSPEVLKSRKRAISWHFIMGQTQRVCTILCYYGALSAIHQALHLDVDALENKRCTNLVVDIRQFTSIIVISMLNGIWFQDVGCSSKKFV